MKIKFPEPVAPAELYKLKIKNKCFDYDKLENVLGRIEHDLDKICKTKLESDEFCVVSYEIAVYKADTLHAEKKVDGTEINREYLGYCFMLGGFDLSVKEGRKYSLPEFQERYKREFRTALDQIKDNSYKLGIIISLVGFRDKITEEIEA